MVVYQVIDIYIFKLECLEVGIILTNREEEIPTEKNEDENKNFDEVKNIKKLYSFRLII